MKLCSITVICVAALLTQGLAVQAASDFNVILITLDSVRADHISSYGYSRQTTPAIDRIAAQGTLFEKVYAQAPWTAPSLASLLTSRYNEFHGTNIANVRLDQRLPTLTRLLRNAGYQTFSSLSGLACEDGAGFEDDFETSYSSLAFTDAELLVQHAASWINDNSQAPFFLWIHAMNSHIPYLCPQPYRDQFNPTYKGPLHQLDDATLSKGLHDLLAFIDHYNYKQNKEISGDFDPQLYASLTRLQKNEKDVAHFGDHYDGCLNYMDQQIAGLEKLIERKNLNKKTIWIIAADHGDYLGHAAWTDNPRIAHPVADLHEELLRVPLIIKHPSYAKGLRVAQPVMLIDIAPTVLSVLNLDIPKTMQGSSLEALMRPTHPAVIRPYVYASDYEKKGWTWALISEDWKLARRTDGRLSLINLREDSRERNDLIDKAPAQFLNLGGLYLDSIATASLPDSHEDASTLFNKAQGSTQ